ncbi:S-adenosyl-L-methionine-dependent methyltransferase [Xylaria intraflava]|nr:S-adenosyl-L-methionine-dependent methyltransferase [Xylaria intraflava]
MATALPENLKERVKDSYDAIAAKYNEWTVPHYKYRTRYLEQALSRLSKSEGLAFLELGCGSGVPVTKGLLAHPGVAKVVANDLSDTQLAIARGNLVHTPDDARRLTLLPGDMSSLDFQDGSFDLVAAFYSFVHLPRAEQAVLFERVARWLRPGGYLVANFGRQDKEVMVQPKWLDEKGWMFWSGWGEEATLGKIRDAGLEVVVAEVVTDSSADVSDSSFLWVIARR